MSNQAAYVYNPADDPYTAFIKRFQHDALGFAKHVLKIELLPWQEELLTAVAKGTRLISVRAGHGVGKTCGVSVVVVWILAVANGGDCKIVVTAPTHSTLKDGLFAEIKKWMRCLPPAILDLFEIQSDRIYLRAAPEMVFCSSRVSTAQSPESLAGIHANKVLICCDEASGIPDPVFHTARGSMSSDGAQTLLISNPTRNSGFFFDTHNSLKDKWHTMHVSCRDNPRVSPEFESEFVFGDDDPEKQIRFYGNFPTSDSNTLIAAVLVDEAMERDIQVDPNAPLVFGLDVARFGPDRSVLCKRRGNVVLDFLIWKGLDTMQLAGAVLHEVRLENPEEVLVDTMGVGGGVADFLRYQGVNCIDINASESSSMNSNASKLRDELWINCRDWLAQRKCKLPHSQDLRKELVGPRMTFLGNGKIKVESKDEMKSRLRGVSPDMADALMLTFASTAANFTSGVRWAPGRPLRRNIRGIV